MQDERLKELREVVIYLMAQVFEPYDVKDGNVSFRSYKKNKIAEILDVNPSHITRLLKNPHLKESSPHSEGSYTNLIVKLVELMKQGKRSLDVVDKYGDAYEIESELKKLQEENRVQSDAIKVEKRKNSVRLLIAYLASGALLLFTLLGTLAKNEKPEPTKLTDKYVIKSREKMEQIMLRHSKIMIYNLIYEAFLLNIEARSIGRPLTTVEKDQIMEKAQGKVNNIILKERSDLEQMQFVNLEGKNLATLLEETIPRDSLFKGKMAFFKEPLNRLRYYLTSQGQDTSYTDIARAVEDVSMEVQSKSWSILWCKGWEKGNCEENLKFQFSSQ